VAALAATSVLTLMATGALRPEPAAAASGLQPFDDCEALASWSKDAMLPFVGPFGLAGPMAMDATAGGVVPAARAESLAAEGAAVGPGATGTNVQEAGVDEPDVGKVAGGLLVTTVGTSLVTVDVSGDRPVRRGSVEIPALSRSGDPGPMAGTAELLLVGSRVLVLGQGWLPGEAVSQGTTTSATVVDVSDPATPVVASSTELEGQYLSARESAGVVRLVVSTTPSLPWVLPDGDGDADTSTARNRQVLAEGDPLSFVPEVVQRSAAGDVVSRRPLMACDAISHPSQPSGPGTISVVTLDVTAPDPVLDAVGVTTDGDLVYASTDRLYVATTPGGWRWAADSRFAGPSGDDGTRTALHGFDTTSRLATRYIASGEVDGWLLGRWALSARDGLLRVATTRGERWAGDPASAPQTDSAVTVLQEQGDELLPVGVVDGLGKGEQIRAVRWFDDLAIVVTFRQTDPLYVVDLSVPTAPTVRGELKVPGYSGYLHPLGGNLLMGIGQDATPDGRTTGAQVATYDLSDLSAPRQVDVLLFPGTWSEAEADSRTFSYLPGRRLALVPMSGEDGATVRAVAVGADGALDETGRYAGGSSLRWQPWLLRAIPVDADRTAVILQDDGAPVVSLLALDRLTETGSLRLG
jgi:Beta propeller domain